MEMKWLNEIQKQGIPVLCIFSLYNKNVDKSNLKSSKLAKKHQYSIISGSINGCAMSTLDKCNGFSVGDTPENMIEVGISFNNSLIQFSNNNL